MSFTGGGCIADGLAEAVGESLGADPRFGSVKAAEYRFGLFAGASVKSDGLARSGWVQMAKAP